MMSTSELDLAKAAVAALGGTAKPTARLEGLLQWLEGAGRLCASSAELELSREVYVFVKDIREGRLRQAESMLKKIEDKAEYSHNWD